MIDPEEIRHIPRIMYEAGVKFVLVETLPKANIDGVCFWEGETPIIGMTTRYDRIDNFWFVIRHEIEHVLKKDGKEQTAIDDVRIDVDLESVAGSSAALPEEEVHANRVAADFCVPSSELDSFYLRKAPYISERDVLGFSGRIQRHPGIVVGHLQRRLGRHDFLARHKVKIRQYLSSTAIVDGWGVAAPVEL
jgi:HTH-type transcriptional regulator/antitoxin HigA